MPRSPTTAIAPPSVHVAKQVIAGFGDRVHGKAICLTTAVPKLVQLTKVQPGPALTAFLKAYEPRIVKHGLYSHQAKIIKSIKKTGPQNIVMTTSTGSGKSLAFWAWAFELLSESKNSTVIATFPTQALLWGQAKRLAAISQPNSTVEFEGLDGVCFSGKIKIAGTTIPWTVWYGTGLY